MIMSSRLTLCAVLLAVAALCCGGCFAEGASAAAVSAAAHTFVRRSVFALTGTVLKKTLEQTTKELDNVKHGSKVVQDLKLPVSGAHNVQQGLVQTGKGKSIAELRAALKAAQAELQASIRTGGTANVAKLTAKASAANVALRKALPLLSQLKAEYRAGFDSQALKLVQAEKAYKAADKSVSSLRATRQQTSAELQATVNVVGGQNAVPGLMAKLAQTNRALRNSVDDLRKADVVVKQEQGKLRAFLDANKPKLEQIRQLKGVA